MTIDGIEYPDKSPVLQTTSMLFGGRVPAVEADAVRPGFDTALQRHDGP